MASAMDNGFQYTLQRARENYEFRNLQAKCLKMEREYQKMLDKLGAKD